MSRLNPSTMAQGKFQYSGCQTKLMFFQEKANP